MLQLVNKKGCIHVRDTSKDVFVRVNRQNVYQAMVNARLTSPDDRFSTKAELISKFLSAQNRD